MLRIKLDNKLAKSSDSTLPHLLCMLLYVILVECRNEGARLCGCMLLYVIVERHNEGIRLRGCILLYVIVERRNEGTRLCGSTLRHWDCLL